MRCPRCQGLIVNEYEEERCLNCGYRTDFVPAERSPYSPYRDIVDQPTVLSRPLTSPSDAKACVRERVRKCREKKRLAVEA